jgi:hypothetical protein
MTRVRSKRPRYRCMMCPSASPGSQFNVQCSALTCRGIRPFLNVKLMRLAPRLAFVITLTTLVPELDAEEALEREKIPGLRSLAFRRRWSARAATQRTYNSTASTAMESAHLRSLAILSIYFVIVIFLFTTILRSIPTSDRKPRQRNAFKLLTVLSFAHTWYCKSVSRTHNRLKIMFSGMNRHVRLHEGATQFSHIYVTSSYSSVVVLRRLAHLHSQVSHSRISPRANRILACWKFPLQASLGPCVRLSQLVLVREALSVHRCLLDDLPLP